MKKQPAVKQLLARVLSSVVGILLLKLGDKALANGWPILVVAPALAVLLFGLVYPVWLIDRDHTEQNRKEELLHSHSQI